MPRSRPSLILVAVVIILTGAAGFLLMAQQMRATPGSSDAAPRSSQSEAMTTFPSGDAHPKESPHTSDAEHRSETSSGPLHPRAPQKDQDGNFFPTGAGSDAYPHYLGGDFDDTSPNTVSSFGVDENGCDANYAGACVPPLPARTICAEINVANFEVVNGDPQGLDPDGDGIACDDESIVRTDYGEDTQSERD